VLDHNGNAGAAIDNVLDKSRNGRGLATAAAVSTDGGKFVALEHSRGTASAARLNPIGAAGRTVAARGSSFATTICSHAELTSLKEGSQGKGVVECIACGLGDLANANARGVDGTFSVHSARRRAMAADR
jgi:hypothetical protein